MRLFYSKKIIATVSLTEEYDSETAVPSLQKLILKGYFLKLLEALYDSSDTALDLLEKNALQLVVSNLGTTSIYNGELVALPTENVKVVILKSGEEVGLITQGKTTRYGLPPKLTLEQFEYFERSLTQSGLSDNKFALFPEAHRRYTYMSGGSRDHLSVSLSLAPVQLGSEPLLESIIRDHNLFEDITVGYNFKFLVSAQRVIEAVIKTRIFPGQEKKDWGVEIHFLTQHEPKVLTMNGVEFDALRDSINDQKVNELSKLDLSDNPRFCK